MRYVCANCGSDKLVWRGYMVWDEVICDWVCTQADDEAYCDNCDRECEPLKKLANKPKRSEK